MPNPMSLFGLVAKIGDVTDQMLKALGWSRGKLEDMLSSTNGDSLMTQVSGSVSVVPVIITADIPEQAASIIAQMSEIEFANYMTLALANSPKINIHDINDGKYLRKYHTNLNKLESIISESFDEDNEMEASLARSLCETVCEMNTRVQPTIMNHLMKTMNEAMTVKNKHYGLEWLMEASKDEEEYYRKTRKQIFDGGESGTLDEEAAERKRKYIDDIVKSVDRQHEREREEREDQHRAARERISDIGSAASLGLNVAKTASSEIRNWKKYADDKDSQKRREQREEEQTIDSHVTRDFAKTYSIKKLNEMQPTPVVARIFSVDDNGTPSRQIEIVSGVKVKLHQINKKEFISLMKSEDPGNVLTSIIRFTTGETRFFHDIVLGNGSIKEYAAKSGRFSSTGAKVLATLKRVKDLNRTGKNLKPNAILVVSKAAVDELKRIHGIDLLDEDDASQICDRLSLIKLIISDPVGGKLHTLMPGLHDSFSVVSTDTLEKQIDATQDAALTKELRKIISKGA